MDHSVGNDNITAASDTPPTQIQQRKVIRDVDNLGSSCETLQTRKHGESVHLNSRRSYTIDLFQRSTGSNLESNELVVLLVKRLVHHTIGPLSSLLLLRVPIHLREYYFTNADVVMLHLTVQKS